MRLRDRQGFLALLAMGYLALSGGVLEAKATRTEHSTVAGLLLPACRTSDPRGSEVSVFAQPAAQPMTSRVAPPRSTPSGPVRDIERPRAIVPLYMAMFSLQTLDVVSTRRALNAGAQEANPIVAPIVGSAGGMIALKAGAAGAMVYIVEHMWKRNRKAAILALIGTNIGYGAIVAHNLSLAAPQ